ncbi:MAG TPA: SRPBCC domain-containing protein [Gemmatimonadaceae bacterium]
MAAPSAANKRDTASAEPTLVIKRTFDAPRDLVWKVWSDPEQAKKWWGPDGFTAPVVELDARPGGKWRALMRSPDGKDIWQHGVYREIVPPEKISFTFIWDAQPDHEMLVSITFAERGKKTEMTFRQGLFESADERNGHEGGWSQSFDRFAAYLKTMKGDKHAR